MTRAKNLVDLAKEARGVEPTVRLHLIYICGYAYSSKEYYASQATLASDTETSVSSVFRTIKWLVAQQILIPVPRKRRATKTYMVKTLCRISDRLLRRRRGHESTLSDGRHDPSHEPLRPFGSDYSV